MGLFGGVFGGGNKPPEGKPEQERFVQNIPQEERPEFLVSFVNDEFKRRQDERVPFEIQWRLNMAFLEGNQYVDINPSAMNIEEVPQMYPWQEREVFNMIAPNVEVRIAKLTRNRPILKATPGSSEQKDIRAAKVSTSILKDIYNDREMQGTLNEAYTWMEACGSVFMKNVWNRNKGPLVAKIMSEDGAESEIREGDLEPVLCPAPELFPDTCYHQDIDDCKSIIHAKNYHVDEIEETWGVKVNPEESTALKLQRNMIGMGGLGYGQGGFSFNTIKLKGYALVKEYWERPSKKFPKGRLIIVANQTLLFNGPLPYRVDDDQSLGLPFRKCDCITRPGVFYGRTVIERMIPPQRRYNSLRNRKAEYLNRCAIGQWIVQENSVDMDYMEAEAGAPGAIITYKLGSAAPKQGDNPQFPVAFETEENTLLQELSILSGVSEVSRQSSAPAGVKSGVALSLALEQDDTRLSATVNNIELFLVGCGKQWLRLYKQYVKGVRVLRSINRNNVVELIDWTNSDVRSEDVIVESFSALAESPAQRRQMVFDLLNTPLVLDPDTGKITKETQSKLLEMIELNYWEDSQEDDTDLHINKAERENIAMEQGQLPNAVPYDDHIIHISRHNKYRLTTDFEDKCRANPIVAQVFEQHVQQHVMAMTPVAPAMPQNPVNGQGGEPSAGTPTSEPPAEQQPQIPA